MKGSRFHWGPVLTGGALLVAVGSGVLLLVEPARALALLFVSSLAGLLLAERHRFQERIDHVEAESRRIGDELANEHEFLHNLLDEVPDSIYFKDTDSRILRINRSCAAKHGLPSPAAAVGKTDADFFAADAAQAMRVDEQKVMTTGQPLVGKEEQENWPDGRVTWAMTTTMPFRNGRGEVVGVVGVSRDVTARKQADETVRQTEEKFRGIFESAVEGIYQTSLDGRFLTANPMLAQIFGFASADELMAVETAGNWFYADPGRRSEFIRRVQAQGTMTGFESQVRRRDGTLVWVSENARTVRDGDGRMVGYAGTVIDITERKRAEETLRRANDTLRAVIQASPLAIITLDLSGVIRSWNVAAERMFGWTAPEVLDRPTPLVPDDKRHEYHDLVARLSRGEAFSGVQARRRRKDGSLFDVSVSAAPLYDAAGKVSGIMAVFADITDVKRTEQALAQERVLLRCLIDSIPDLIFYKDRIGVFLGCNAAFEKRVGKSETEIRGKRTDELFGPHECEIYGRQDRQVLENQQPLRIEEWITYPDGRRVLIEMLKSPFTGPTGDVLGLIGISRDITERHRLEDQLRQAQKMEAIGQLAGGVAHDFNNLLTAILGNVSLFLGSWPVDEPGRDLLLDIEKATLRAAELTKQLLGFSRQTRLRLEPTNVNAAVEETVSILRRTIDPRIDVEVRTAPDLWSVQADANQLDQVLMNLCLNARDAMPDGGRLVLETRNIVLDEHDASRHLEARTGEFLRLRVQDSGCGIPADVRPRIFDPFFTTKEPGKGTGLGLAMVFGIVKQHQGWIECASEVGHGTNFDIYLPRHRASVAPAAAPSQPLVARGGSETILLVDDEAVIRNLGRTILQRHGYHVLLAEDGLDAVQTYQREQERIDLVILDITMPRLSGRDALRRLLQLDPEVRVLFSSGYSAEVVTESEGVLGFVNKPYRPQDLVATVRMALDKAKPAEVR